MCNDLLGASNVSSFQILRSIAETPNYAIVASSRRRSNDIARVREPFSPAAFFLHPLLPPPCPVRSPALQLLAALLDPLGRLSSYPMLPVPLFTSALSFLHPSSYSALLNLFNTCPRPPPFPNIYCSAGTRFLCFFRKSKCFHSRESFFRLT